MRAVVTGGAGVCGINLIRHLIGKGLDDIISIDIADFNYPEKGRVKAVRGDVRDAELMSLAMAGADVVIHAAAALPLYKKKDIYSIDVCGTRTALEAAFRNGVERFIHISTTAVYGLPKHHPVREEDPLEGAKVGDYGRAKIMAEEICRDYRKKGMCVAILRPKSFVGPERLGIFAILYEWAREGRNFPIIGKGDNLFQLLDVDDLSEVIYACMIKNKMMLNDAFNIGASEFQAIRKDFQAVLDHAGHNKRVIPLPIRPALWSLSLLYHLGLSPVYKWSYDTVYRESFVSIEKAQRVLGFNPKYSNQDALIRNYEWYLDNLDTVNKTTGISHRVPWDQGVLRMLKVFF